VPPPRRREIAEVNVLAGAEADLVLSVIDIPQLHPVAVAGVEDVVDDVPGVAGQKLVAEVSILEFAIRIHRHVVDADVRVGAVGVRLRGSGG
jgi:hypothetical protein